MHSRQDRSSRHCRHRRMKKKTNSSRRHRCQSWAQTEFLSHTSPNYHTIHNLRVRHKTSSSYSMHMDHWTHIR